MTTLDPGAATTHVWDMPHPLDRPIWSALTSAQAPLSRGNETAKRFAPDVSPLAAARDASPEACAALADLIPAGDDISLLEPQPPSPPPGVTEIIRRAGVQMVATAPAAPRPLPGVRIDPLGEADAAEMLALALLTRPGPFRTRTHTLGRFVGVRDNGALIAMAGERLATAEFIEVSAVCTHPDHRGRGVGAALLSTVAQRILADGKTPFLHSYADNAPALALYRALGFETRLEVQHAIWKRA